MDGPLRRGDTVLRPVRPNTPFVQSVAWSTRHRAALERLVSA